jgi:hypothetical protein
MMPRSFEKKSMVNALKATKRKKEKRIAFPFIK